MLSASLMIALNLLPNKEIILGFQEMQSLLTYQLPTFINLNENFVLVKVEERINVE